MYGDSGAVKVFARKYGASKKQIEKLEQGMQHYAQVLQTYNSELNPEFPEMGAAGGIACTLTSVFTAK